MNPNDFRLWTPPSSSGDLIRDDVVDVDDTALEDFKDTVLDEDDIRIKGKYSDFAQQFVTVNREPLSLEGREYLKPVYDLYNAYPRGSRDVVVIAGRQVEKSLEENEPVLLANGDQISIKDVRVGDEVATMMPDLATMSVGSVTWVSSRYRKDCVRIHTRQGHSILLATTHPLRTWQSWEPAENLEVGDRIAVVRKSSIFTGSSRLRPDLVSFAAFMLGDGSCGGERGTQFGFTQNKGTAQLREFLSIVEREGWNYRLNAETNKRASEFVSFSRAEGTSPRKYLEEWGLWGKTSETKSFPSWVWDLDEDLTALFLNRLWSTDGCVSQNDSGRLHIEYASISEEVVHSVQRLLWKFGIPSKIRSHVPAVYVRTGKKSFILRVETREGLRRFLTRVGALGKSEGVELPSTNENNNRDTYPEGMASLIHEASGKRSNRSEDSLYRHGLRFTPKYPVTKPTLQRYIDVLRTDPDADQKAVDLLERHLFTDLFWDVITKIEPAGNLWCRDIAVEKGESFVTDGIVSHNSSTMASIFITRCCVNPSYQALIIQPRDAQTKIFSQQRFDPMATDSEILQEYWLGTKNVWQVGSKIFNNGAVSNFKSCFYSADPIRGITAGGLGIDELQDIISDNIPVLEECQSHVLPEDRFNLYAGTPKTTSNTLNLHYKETTQFEWLVKCQACSNYNFLDAKVIGKHHYICKKCGKQIYPTEHGSWVAMRPSKMNDRWGFRISQLMVPFMTHGDVLAKMENPNIPTRVFHNEVLGLSYDVGQLLLTEADILKRCEPRPPDNHETIHQRQDVFLCAGIDHGTGDYAIGGMGDSSSGARRSSKPSFTAVAFGGFCSDNRFRIFALTKFTGEMANLARQPEILDELIRSYGARWVMSDHGFGAHTNARLVSDHSWTRVEDEINPLLMECEYSGIQKIPIKWHPHAYRYIVKRNFAIEHTVDGIKKGEILFFRDQEMRSFLDDFTTMFTEYDFRSKSVRYDHVLPDDCFQAVIYCYLAALQRRGRLTQSFG